MNRTPAPTGINAEMVNAIANLDPRVMITVQVMAGDLARAFQEVQGGPAELSPGKAALRFGRSAKYWRQQAEAGVISGAYKDAANERWYLPTAACREHLAAKAAPENSGTGFKRLRPRGGGRPR